MTTGTPSPEDVTRIGSTGPLGEEGRSPGAVPSFKSYMEQKGAPNPLLSQGSATGQVSPFDLAHGQVPAAGPTLATLADQAKVAQTSLGDLANQLTTPNLKLKQSSRYILKNKLTDANTQFRSANAKMGAQEVEEKEVPAGTSPVNRFLSYVTDGQNQLQSAVAQLSALKDKGESLSPGDLLLIQIKLNKAQQEIEYSSVLLSKAIDDMKMLFNIQL